MIIYFLFALPYTFVPIADKIQAANEVVKDVSYMQTYKATMLENLFPVSALYLSRPILVLLYTLWSIGLFINYLIKKKESVVLSKQHFMKKWLCLLLGLLLVLEVTQIILIIKGFKMHFSDLYFTLNIIRVLSALGLIGLIVSPFFFPNILYGLPRMPDSLNERNTEKRLTHLRQLKKIPNNNHFEDSYLHLIGKKADACMKEHKPYLQPDCNLTHLAKHVNLPAHHLAYYFREVKKQTFNDYRNEWRINHAKKLIEEGKASEMTLEAIGMLSGFSSRNAFITDFKKVEGISPGVYASRLN